ncbi:MAG: transposase [Candidatus Brocadiae bacterium]|nr:transposase [Candidatus Brocadiia bacterium]
MSEMIFPLQSLPPYVRYERLFRHLPPLPTSPKRSRRGRPGVPPEAILRAHIYRALRAMPRLVDLVFELRNNPCIVKALGFDPLRAPPSLERFSAFLHDTGSNQLQQIHHDLVAKLIEKGAIDPRVLAIDSCPIPARVKENNLKTGISRNRYDKQKPPKGDPEAGLGVLVHYPRPHTKRVSYFWGYRNHVLSDAESEIPLAQITLPANASEVKQAVPLLRLACQTYGLWIEAVVADAEYDAESILKFIVEKLRARPYIAANPRRSRPRDHAVGADPILCEADLPMVRKGRMTVHGITYVQYVCPLHYRKKQRQRYLFCPAQHPKYVEQKGCNTLIRLTPTIRSTIPYGTRQFRHYYNKRTAAERIFSRLLALAMQEPTVKGLQAVRNHCTIAHITTCLVALVAHQEGHADKLRFVRTLVPNFLV